MPAPRPKFVKCAESFDANITVSKDGQIGARHLDHGADDAGRFHWHPIMVEASGPQAEAAMSALEDLVTRKFDED